MIQKFPLAPADSGNSVSSNGNDLFPGENGFFPSGNGFFPNMIGALFQQLPFRIHAGFTVKNSGERKFSVAGATHEDNLSELMNRLLGLHLQVTEISTLHYRGLYFEASPEWYGLVLAPRKEIVSLDQRLLNQTDVDRPIFELKEFGREHLIENLIYPDYEACLSIWSSMERIWGEALGISRSKLALAKYENSHKEYIRHYLDFKANRSVFRYDPGQCNNIIALFGWIYYWEIKILAWFMNHQRFSLHDVGTSLAQFPLLLSSLSGEELLGLDIAKIWASDKGWTGEIFVKRIIAKNPEYRPVHFLKLDLIEDMDKMPVTDVIVANDVLEHLPDEATAFSVLKGLWNKTSKILIVHVPFEAEPNPAWDHHVGFHESKIRDWAGELPGACFLSDQFYDGPETLTANGYLIVTR